MPTPYRVPSPPPPEEPEAEEPYAKVLRRQQRRARIAAIAVGCAIGVGVIASAARPVVAQTPVEDAIKRKEARRIRAREAIASARSRAAVGQDRFAVAIRAAVAAKVQPKAELGACPVELAQPSGIGRPFPLVVVDQKDVA